MRGFVNFFFICVGSYNLRLEATANIFSWPQSFKHSVGPVNLYFKNDTELTIIQL